jgi:alpha-amylase/alpha-mannosidase (GH57 family)
VERFICVHAHFYQPPRENPWLETIELQDSAYPYHDWNERITAECYAPNMASRILDETDRIIEMVNIYSRISFNFGPTLLSWLEEKVSDLYRSILDADRESAKRFSGHGSALAQVYNHMIMPLANERDRITQVRWGIADFRQRFGRDPEGMWLAETGVDIATLEALAREGIRFTILAPNQAAGVRKIGARKWQDVTGSHVDPTRAYRIRLPSRRKMTLFFYDGPISRSIAFEDLLQRGEDFAERLMGGFSEERDWPQLVNIATDGETYGHHHQFGDMALSYALHYIETNNLARLTNYGEYLELHPPTHEVKIVEDSSWSCVHGIERWRSDCGCSTGREGWNQAWRAPLREALDWLRDQVAPLWEKKGHEWLKNPWSARNAYVDVILNRDDPQALDRFLERHGRVRVKGDSRVQLIRLMELQRHAMLMYTSCGWFFGDLSGIETVQIIQYAGRVLQIARDVLGEDLEPGFLERLEKAESNLPEQGNGRRIFENCVRPAQVDLNKVAAHYAMTSLFESYREVTSIYSYLAEQEDHRIAESGKARLVVGRARFTSQITGRSAQVSFGVLHLGDHNINCGVRAFLGQQEYEKAAQDIHDAFASADYAETIRRVDNHFGPVTYSLKSLFRDEQRKILKTVLGATLDDAESSFRQLYDSHAPLMRFLKDSRVPLPRALFMAAEFVFNLMLRQAMEEGEFARDKIVPLLEEARREEIPLDHATLEYAFRRSLEKSARRFHTAPEEKACLLKLKDGASLLEALPFEVNLWTVQNLFYDLLENFFPRMEKRAADGDGQASEWVGLFTELGDKLKVRVF